MSEAINKLLEFLTEFNFQTILSMAIIMWYFTRDIKNSIEALDKDVRAMNTRISRLEGSVYGREVYNHVQESAK